MFMIDSGNAAQIASLFDQEMWLIDAMGGLFSERSEHEMSHIFDVLDIACRPGSWVLEVAQAYPEIEVVGIDTSRSVISYARAHAEVRRLTNAHFYTMNVIEPLHIPDESFDLINICPLVGSVPPHRCSQVLSECMRLLRPGGVMRLTEGDWGNSNALAFETLNGMSMLATMQEGQTFSPTGRTIGPPQIAAHLLRKAGFHSVRSKPYALDFSAGSAACESMCQNYKVLFKLAEPFLLNAQVVTQHEFDRLYEQTLVEMMSDDFCAGWMGLTAWGEKPCG